MPDGETVDPQSATPVYVQVADILRSRIQSGRLLPDRPVPSEAQRQQEFGVARGTARQAIALLREQGLVVTVKGRGSYVTPSRRPSSMAGGREGGQAALDPGDLGLGGSQPVPGLGYHRGGCPLGE